jgi:hypothetical protein
MANDSIIFLCNGCGVKLTVPWEMAGVVGPCPSCQAEIQAPYPLLDLSAVSIPTDTQPAYSQLPPDVPVVGAGVVSQSSTGALEEISQVVPIESDFGLGKQTPGEIELETLIEKVIQAEPEHTASDFEESTPAAVAEEMKPLSAADEMDFFGAIDDELIDEIAPGSVLAAVAQTPLPTRNIVRERLDDSIPKLTEVKAEALGEIKEEKLPTLMDRTVGEVPMILASPVTVFPKTPPPFPVGLGSPESSRPALAIHPSLTVPRTDLSLVDDITTAEPLFDPPFEALDTGKVVAAAPLEMAGNDIDLPLSQIADDKLSKLASPRLPIRTLPENMKQFPAKRGPTTAYPEPRKPLGGSPQAELEAVKAEAFDFSDEEGMVAKKGAKRRTQRQSNAVKILMLAVFLVLLVGTFLVLWNLKKKQASESLQKEAKSERSSQVAQPQPPPVTPDSNVPILVKPKVEPPASAEAVPTPPVEPELSTPARAAMNVLEKFFSVQTLAERLPLIETKTPEEELMISSIASSLPKVGRISIEAVENNAAKQVIDYFYHVQFENLTLGIPSVAVLVRTRGAGEPKVVVDPFLDSFGGRLAAFASKPSDQVGTFQVIVWPLAACYDLKVPNRNDKLTLKLLAKDDTKEIVLAYFSKQSQIAAMLEDDSHRLSYGKAQVATISLRWNSKDNQAPPFFEVFEIKALNWDP